MGCSESRKHSEQHSLNTIKNSSKYQFEVYAALKQNNFNKIRELIPARFEPTFKMPLFMGKTVLHLAGEFCDSKTIAYLLSLGADVNALDNSGCPPIFAAMRNGNLEAVNAILKIGSKVNINIVTNHDLHFHDFISQNKFKESMEILKRINYNKLKL